MKGALMGRIVYLGAMLTDKSVALLYNTFPPKHTVVYGEHVTVRYRPEAEQVANFPVGRRVKFHSIMEIYDERCQAVLVDLPTDNTWAHITISTAKDTPPVYSNSMIERFFLSSRNGFVRSENASVVALTAILDTFPYSRNLNLMGFIYSRLLPTANKQLQQQYGRVLI